MRIYMSYFRLSQESRSWQPDAGAGMVHHDAMEEDHGERKMNRHLGEGDERVAL